MSKTKKKKGTRLMRVVAIALMLLLVSSFCLPAAAASNVAITVHKLVVAPEGDAALSDRYNFRLELWNTVNDTNYTVNYLSMEAGNAAIHPAKTGTLEVGSTINAADEVIPIAGWAYQNPSAASITLKSDGSNVLNLYYGRLTNFTVKYYFKGTGLSMSPVEVLLGTETGSTLFPGRDFIVGETIGDNESYGGTPDDIHLTLEIANRYAENAKAVAYGQNITGGRVYVGTWSDGTPPITELTANSDENVIIIAYGSRHSRMLPMAADDEITIAGEEAEQPQEESAFAMEDAFTAVEEAVSAGTASQSVPADESELPAEDETNENTEENENDEEVDETAAEEEAAEENEPADEVDEPAEETASTAGEATPDANTAESASTTLAQPALMGSNAAALKLNAIFGQWLFDEPAPSTGISTQAIRQVPQKISDAELARLRASGMDIVFEGISGDRAIYTFSLAHDQKLEVENLPANTGFLVKELGSARTGPLEVSRCTVTLEGASGGSAVYPVATGMLPSGRGLATYTYTVPPVDTPVTPPG